MSKLVRKFSRIYHSELANEFTTDLQPLNQNRIKFNDAQKRIFKHQHKGS